MSKSALRRRVAPSVPLQISFSDEKGSFTHSYRVAFNLNVLSEISEKTGLSALNFDIWTKLNAKVLLVMLWAALLPNHEEFDTRDRDGHRTDEGLETIGSWFDGENQEKAASALWDAYLLYLPKDQADLLRKEREKAEKERTDGGLPPPGGEPPLAIPATETSAPESTGSDSGLSVVMTSESVRAKSAT